MTKWEYLLETDASPGRLKELGRSGWEAVGIAYTPGMGRHTVLFKRPLYLSGKDQDR